MLQTETYSSESQMDSVTGESANTSTVTVTWEKKNEDREHNDIQEETSEGEPMVFKETAGEVVSKRELVVGYKTYASSIGKNVLLCPLSTILISKTQLSGPRCHVMWMKLLFVVL